MADFDPKIFQALRGISAEERKKGVIALARSGDRAAFRYLATIYEDDVDPSVRQLALDAGKHIKRMEIENEWMGEGVKGTQEMRVPQIAVSDSDQKLSKKHIDDAVKLSHSGDYDRAEALAVKAFSINPNLQNDPYYSGLASEIMGMSTTDAIAEIMARIDTDS
ncbi:MAG: hypothetical protein WBC91_02110 [Phototrophicaceae bacterium]